MKKLAVYWLIFCLLAAPALAQQPADDEIWYEPGPEPQPDPREIQAEQWLLEADPDAANAENIYAFPSGESDGAWVFCATGVKVPYFAGEFWYLDGENAYSLGKGKQFYHWERLNTVPEVFCCSIGKPDVRRANASILVDGKPFELAGTEKFASLGERNGCMYGWVDGFDYAFLCVDNNELCEVEAVSIDKAQFMAFDGAQEILDVLEQYAPGAKVRSVLYRSTGVITMNVDTRDGEKFMHIWMNADGRLVETRSFGDMLALHDGEGTASRNTGLRVIGSELPE